MIYTGLSVLKRGKISRIVLKRCCSKCGYIVNDDNARFCVHCGRKFNFKQKYYGIDDIIEYLNKITQKK